MLLPQHQRLIEGSAISAEVASARGYRSVGVRAELRRLGFSDYQCRVPALLIPVWNVAGETATYQARPDDPRVAGGKALKYETPASSRMALDVPPVAREQLADPRLPLFITEGVRKADAAASRSLCCIDLLGVWNWRGTNALGGKTALPDWDAVALNGRAAYICFDSDVMEKQAVRQALERLRAFLELRKASVRVVYLPPGPHGEKTGLDDFFARGGSCQELLALASPELQSAPPAPGEKRAGPYISAPSGISRVVEGRDGQTTIPLSNFDARIVAQVVRDDGAEEARLLEIQASAGGRERRFEVAAASFAGMDWVIPQLGSEALVYPGSGTKDHLRASIQMLSGSVAERRIYAHTGWRRIGDRWAYLHAGGAIGPDGPLPGVQLQLDSSLSAARLELPADNEEAAFAVRSLLRILELWPARDIFPLFSCIWTAALSEPDFGIFTAGQSGQFKSAVAALVQQCWGSGFDARHLPANWSSTANALEALAFAAKNMVLTVDDFVPRGASGDIARLHAQAERLFRGQGNHQGRQRLRADGTPRPVRPPRGLVLATGEDVPRGQSLQARMLVIEVGDEPLDVQKLSQCQSGAAAGLHAKALGAFLRWFASDFDGLLELFAAEARRLRDEASVADQHRRTPEIAAQLGAGLKLFTSFAQMSGCLDGSEADDLWERGWPAILEAARSQAGALASSDPAARYLELLRSCLSSGRAHVADRKGDVPAQAAVWGWQEEPIGQWRASGRRLGWVDGDDLYLDPDAAFSEVQDLACRMGEPLAVQMRTLHRRLFEQGRLLSVEGSRRTLTTRAVLAGARRPVLHLRAASVMPVEADQPDQTDHPEREEP